MGISLFYLNCCLRASASAALTICEVCSAGRLKLRLFQVRSAGLGVGRLKLELLKLARIGMHDLDTRMLNPNAASESCVEKRQQSVMAVREAPVILEITQAGQLAEDCQEFFLMLYLCGHHSKYLHIKARGISECVCQDALSVGFGRPFSE